MILTRGNSYDFIDVHILKRIKNKKNSNAEKSLTIYMYLKTIRRQIYRAHFYTGRLVDSVMRIINQTIYVHLCLKSNSFARESARYAFYSLPLQTRTVSSPFKASKSISVFVRQSYPRTLPPPSPHTSRRYS